MMIQSSVGAHATNSPEDLSKIKWKLNKLGFKHVTDLRAENNLEGLSGFYNRELVQETDEQFDWCTDWLADFINRTAQHYRNDYLKDTNKYKSLIILNDCSLPFGGANKDHAGHQSGRTVDIPLPWKDGRAFEHGMTLYDSKDRCDHEAIKAMLAAMGEAMKDSKSPKVSRVLLTWRKDDEDWNKIAKSSKDDLGFELRNAGFHRDHLDLELLPPEIERTDNIPSLLEVFDGSENAKQEDKNRIVARLCDLGYYFAALDTWPADTPGFGPRDPQGKREIESENPTKYKVTCTALTPLQWAIKLFNSIVFPNAGIKDDTPVKIPTAPTSANDPKPNLLDWLFAKNAPRWMMMPAGTNEADDAFVGAIKVFQAMTTGSVNVRASQGKIDPNSMTLRWLADDVTNAPKWEDLDGDKFDIVVFPNQPINFNPAPKICSWLHDKLKAVAEVYSSLNPGEKLKVQHPGATQAMFSGPMLSGLVACILLPTKGSMTDIDKKEAIIKQLTNGSDPIELVVTWYDKVDGNPDHPPKKADFGYLVVTVSETPKISTGTSPNPSNRVIFLQKKTDLSPPTVPVDNPFAPITQVPRVGLVCGINDTNVSAILLEFQKPCYCTKSTATAAQEPAEVEPTIFRETNFFKLELEKPYQILGVDTDASVSEPLLVQDQNGSVEWFQETLLQEGTKLPENTKLNIKKDAFKQQGFDKLFPTTSVRIKDCHLDLSEFSRNDSNTTTYQGKCDFNLHLSNDICPTPLDLKLDWKPSSDNQNKLSLEYYEVSPYRTEMREAVDDEPADPVGQIAAPAPAAEADDSNDDDADDDWPISLDQSVQSLEGYKFTFDIPKIPDDWLAILGLGEISFIPKAEVLLCPSGVNDVLISAGLRLDIKGTEDIPLDIKIPLGSPMVTLEAKIKASAYIGLLGIDLKLEDFSGVKLCLDLFSKNDSFVMNHLWENPNDKLISFGLTQGITQEEFQSGKYRFLWSGPGAIRVNSKFFKKLLKGSPSGLEINPKVLDSLTATLPGSDDQLQVKFAKEGGHAVIGPPSDSIRITVPLKLEVVKKTATPAPSTNPILSGPCNVIFTIPLNSNRGMIQLPTGAIHCEANSELTVDEKDGLHQTLSDLMSLHIPNSSKFNINLNAGNPSIAWAPATNSNTPLTIRIPAETIGSDSHIATAEARESYDKFVFALDSFAIRSSGLDVQGTVKPLRFSFAAADASNQKEHIFTEPLATKKPEEAKKDNKASATGKFQILQSKLVSANLELSGKLPYFDDATGNLKINVSEKVEGTQRSLSCLGVFDIAGLKEFRIDPLFAKCHVQALTLTTQYTSNKKRWKNEGQITGRIEFGPPPGRSASEMGLISELFNGVCVSAENLKLNDIGSSPITITCPPKQFPIAEVIQVDLRGITIGETETTATKNFNLLGDLTLKKLPGIDSSLTFGGIELIQDDKKPIPKFKVSTIGCELSTEGGFKLKGSLSRKDTDKEFGFGGNFHLATDAIPGVEGMLKLTRIKAKKEDVWVPSMAVFLAKDFEAPLFAGLYLREIGAGLGLRQFLRGLEPQPDTTVSQRILKFVDDPSGLPNPLNEQDWVPASPDYASSPMTWLLVGSGMITYSKLPPKQEHPFVGSLILSIDQDLQTVLAVNAWLFMSPEKSKEADINRRPLVRGAIAFAPKEKRLFAYFRTISNPAFGEKTPKIVSEILSKLQTTPPTHFGLGQVRVPILKRQCPHQVFDKAFPIPI